MTIVDSFPNWCIAEQVLAEERKNKENHVRSGHLSAGLLGNPLQWQILKVFGVSGENLDEYTLRKFVRGKKVEKDVLEWIKDSIVEAGNEEKVVYRGVVGFYDAMIDTSKSWVSPYSGIKRSWDFNKGVVPLEVKSATNSKYKRILEAGKPDRGHCLQGALYALGKQKDWFAVMYVASDDYRVHAFILPVADWKPEVDRIIDRFDRQLLTGRVPAFEPDEKWQGNSVTGKPSKYNPFPEFATMTEDEIEDKLQAMIEANKENLK